MTPRWIAGVDGSDAAVVALGWAARRALERGAELTALGAYVVPAPLALLTAKRGFGVDELGLEATIGHDVDVAVAEVTAEVDHPIDIRIVEGPPAHVLVDASAEGELLIVGRSGSGGLRHLVLGSVSRYCATHARSPVVVVPPSPVGDGVRRIVVGFDGSDHAAAAVRWALEFAGESASVQVVTAIDAAPWIDAGIARERLADEIAAHEAELVDALAGVDPHVEHHVTLADPRRALAEASRDADLVVVGARGRGRIAAELLGSVTTWVLHDAVGPVAVVPGP